jgi:hypothetical protein
VGTAVYAAALLALGLKPNERATALRLAGAALRRRSDAPAP